ncbi:adenine phosphoribosyltransferase [Sphingomonas lacunae]|nr:adenine phosphoribosyltransferase [Sphingomonas lacunae]
MANEPMENEQGTALAAIDAAIRIIPDFPQPGILFRDITPLLADPKAFALAQALLLERARSFSPDAIVAVEARGFLFGAPLALDLAVPLVPVRKPGKLPADTHSVDYGLEYGTDRLEIHSDALARGARVLLVDDLLATGGTVRAAADLVERLGADVVGALFLIELTGLGGAERLAEAHIGVSALLRC